MTVVPDTMLAESAYPQLTVFQYLSSHGVACFIDREHAFDTGKLVLSDGWEAEYIPSQRCWIVIKRERQAT